MPRIIDGIPYYTSDEFKKRYEEGRKDGNSDKPVHGYSEEDLIKARTKGDELYDGQVGKTAREAFKNGMQEGGASADRQALQKKVQNLQSILRAAEINAREAAFHKGRTASHIHAYDLGKEKGKAAVWQAFEQHRSLLAENAVRRFIERGFQKELPYSFSQFLKRLPVSGAPPVFFLPEGGSIIKNGPLVLGHFKIHPIRVASRFLLFYVLPVIAASYVFYKHREKINAEKKERAQLHEEHWIRIDKEIEKKRLAEISQKAHGESEPQYRRRKDVESSCLMLRELQPQQFDLKDFTEKNLQEIAKLKQECDEVDAFHKKMERTMQERRDGSPGDKEFYGLRDKKFYYDEKLSSTGDIYAKTVDIFSYTPPLQKRIVALFEMLIAGSYKYPKKES